MAKKEKLIGVNIGAPIIKARHQDLERQSEDSPYRSVCPTCKEGVLACRRMPATGKIAAIDYCLLCGQRVHYTDMGPLKDL